jgi:hypothetical protein
MVTGYGLRPCKVRIFALLYIVHTGTGAHPASYPVDTGGLSPWGRVARREADHSPPKSATVKKTQSPTSTHHTSPWRSHSLSTRTMLPVSYTSRRKFLWNCINCSVIVTIVSRYGVANKWNLERRRLLSWILLNPKVCLYFRDHGPKIPKSIWWYDSSGSSENLFAFWIF